MTEPSTPLATTIPASGFTAKPDWQEFECPSCGMDWDVHDGIGDGLVKLGAEVRCSNCEHVFKAEGENRPNAYIEVVLLGPERRDAELPYRHLAEDEREGWA